MSIFRSNNEGVQRLMRRIKEEPPDAVEVRYGIEGVLPNMIIVTWSNNAKVAMGNLKEAARLIALAGLVDNTKVGRRLVKPRGTESGKLFSKDHPNVAVLVDYVHPAAQPKDDLLYDR